MTLSLRPPETPLSTLQAIAASGRSGLAKKAQESVKRRLHDQLRKEMGR